MVPRSHAGSACSPIVTAIWEWGTIDRVVGGVYARSIGFRPFGDLLLAETDRLTAQCA